MQLTHPAQELALPPYVCYLDTSPPATRLASQFLVQEASAGTPLSQMHGAGTEQPTARKSAAKQGNEPAYSLFQAGIQPTGPIFFSTAQFLDSVNSGGCVHTGVAAALTVATTGARSPGNSRKVRGVISEGKFCKKHNPDFSGGHTPQGTS